MIIYVSVLINPNKSFNNNTDFVNKFLDEIINHNRGYVDFNLNNNSFINSYNKSHNYSFSKTELDEKIIKKKKLYELVGKLEKNYYVEDLLNSKLFTNMCEFHLIPINGNKFIVVNLYNLIPNLFEIKFKNYKKIFIFSILNKKKYYEILLYNKKTKLFHTHNNNQINKTAKNILENYRLNIFQSIKIKDVIINNVHFRILYEKEESIKKNYMTRTFVDNLYNHYNNINDDENNDIKYIGDNYIIIYDLLDPIKLEYSLIKNIKKDNNEKYKKNNMLFYLTTNYISYFLSWCKALNKNSYNIKTYSELKHSMKRFGINTHLKFFSLVNIDNDEITDIIKISLLVKLIKYIFNREGAHISYNNKSKYLFEDERIFRIFFLIKCFLYTNEISVNEKKKFEEIFEELVFFLNVIFLKLKLIDDYLSLGLLNEKNIKEINIHCVKKNLILTEEIDTLTKKISGFDSTKDFLKHIIFTARKKPFLFLSELEMKLNFVIDPFIKFKSSLSIESMSKKLKLDHISLNNSIDICSYVNSDELGGLILSKLIYKYENKNYEDMSSSDSIQYYENERDANKKNIPIIPNFLNTKSNFKNDYNHSFVNEELDDLTETKSDNNLIHCNFPRKNRTTKKSSLPPSPMKRTSRFLVKENSSFNWFDIKDSFFMKLPSICYKMNFIYEELNNYNKNNDLFIYLKNNYEISDSYILKQYSNDIEIIFDDIHTCTGKIEQTLLHSFFYLFIIFFFIERNNKESQRIDKKIKKIYSSGSYLLSFSDLAIINLFQGLKNSYYIESEEYYSKSVMLLLMLYGDPRGKNNDSNAIMQLPLYEITRKTLKLLKDYQEISQYLLEIYKSLEFFERDKGKLKTDNNITYYDYEKNIMKNIKNILKNSDIILNQKQNENNNNDNNTSFYINEFINKDFYLSKKVFTEEMLNFYRIENFPFFSIEDEIEIYDNKKHSKDFIIYFIKQIQNVLIGKYKLYDEKYINKTISENVFNINDELNKNSFYEDKNHKTYNKSNINIKVEPQTQNEKEFTPSQIIRAFHQSKNLFEFFGNKHKKSENNANNKLNTSLSSRKSDINLKNNEIISNIQKGNKANYTINKKNNRRNNIFFTHFLTVELLQKLSYRNNCPSGIIVSFGNNTHNETGHDDFKAIKYPFLIYKLKNIIIKKIYSGWEHNIIISDNNEIYSFGHNNNYQCGIPINNSSENIIIKNPTNISILNNGMTAISAACGNEHTLILDRNNNVYSFGNNEDGVLGVENNKLKSYKFIKVNFGMYNNRIKSISAGTAHNIALTDDGNIFSWGSAQGGQLGLSEKYLSQHKIKDYFIPTPTLVPIKSNISKDIKIIKISSGEAHTLVLNNKKEVYSWGFGSNGQLGLGFCEDSFEIGTGLSNSRIFTPKKIDTFENKILINDIQCGKTFSMFIDTNGGLYSCGVNDLNQLGIPESPPQDHLKNKDCQCKDFVIPTKLIYFSNMKVEKIACGEAHCVAIIKGIHSNDRNIWSWGNNRYGQLGLGDKIKCSLPKPNSFLIEYKDNKFESVSCGGFHSLCLINNSDDINWIEDDFKNIICKIINDIGII